MASRVLRRVFAALTCVGCCSDRDLRQRWPKARESKASASASSSQALALHLLNLQSIPAWQSVNTAHRSGGSFSHRRLLDGRMSESDESNLGDWRDFRARLVAREKQEEQAAASTDGSVAAAGEPEDKDGFAFECPVIEQGSIIMGGTKGGPTNWALDQQYFHKCVILLLEHSDEEKTVDIEGVGTVVMSGTKGLILNRPSARQIDGWRVWCGGPCSSGAMFESGVPIIEDDDWWSAEGKKEDLEITCLHSLKDEAANDVSKEVIKGILYTNLTSAKSLIDQGIASKSDFWLFVGFAGWVPRQLQGEVDRDIWFTASADGGTLLKELLRKSQELPPTSSATLDGEDGVDVWEKLMLSIGQREEVESSRGTLNDKMLGEWARANLLPKKIAPPSPSTESSRLLIDKNLDDINTYRTDPLDPLAALLANPVPELPQMTAGTVFCSGTDIADRFLLADQFLLKSVFVSLFDIEVKINGGTDNVILAAVLNRPTNTGVQFQLPGDPTRLINFGGNSDIETILDENGNNIGEEILDENGFMWLVEETTLKIAGVDDDFGNKIGNSGLCEISSMQGARAIAEGTLSVTDVLLVMGVVTFRKKELEGMLAKEEVRIVHSPVYLWPMVMKASSEGFDGTTAWEMATKLADRGPDAPVLGQEGLKRILDELTQEGLKNMREDQRINGANRDGLVNQVLREWIKNSLV